MRCGCARHFQRRHKTNKNLNINTELIILKGPFRRGWKKASSEAQGHSAHPYFCFLSSFTHKDWFSFRVFELVSVALSFPQTRGSRPTAQRSSPQAQRREGFNQRISFEIVTWPSSPTQPRPLHVHITLLPSHQEQRVNQLCGLYISPKTWRVHKQCRRSVLKSDEWNIRYIKCSPDSLF